MPSVGEAINVNAFDEALDSSWFQNRSSPSAISDEVSVRGPCPARGVDGTRPWRVVSAKPDGASPGFVFESEGQRYLAKFDGASGSPRASLADVFASRLYHAAGFHVPCNEIVYFEPAILQIEPNATIETAAGREEPMTAAHLRAVLAKALQRSDGRYRAMVSTYLEGRPLGPWRYHGVRADDRNDIIPHEDRRELRGSRLLAAWTDHVDQREGNTLSMWRETEGGQGYVMHHLIDFGDCFGSIWGGPAQESWRRGHDYWLDPRTIVVDFVTLGLIERPWDRARLGPLGTTLGFYDVEQFDPERWRPRYPNPAFGRMTERDAAWMARIIARLDAQTLERMLDQLYVDDRLRSRLLEIVLGRRERILRRYLGRLSPLADPQIERRQDGEWLCVSDLAVLSGIVRPRAYVAQLEVNAGQPLPVRVQARTGAEPCLRLPALERHDLERGGRVVAELWTQRSGRGAARFHLHARAPGWLVAGIERRDE